MLGEPRTGEDARRRRRRRRRLMRRVRRNALPLAGWAALVITVAVLGGLVVTGALSGGSQASDSDGARYEPQQRQTTKSMLVIGDSWTRGENDDQTWPYRMDIPAGWTVTTDAVGGSGYVGDHADSALTHGGRLHTLLTEYDPDLVLVALGRNDVQHDPNTVVPVARRDLRAMKSSWPRARIVVFSPFSPVGPDSYTAALAVGLKGLSQKLGLEFVDVTDVIGSQRGLTKDAHPTDAGQDAIAAGVRPKLAALHAFGVS